MRSQIDPAETQLAAQRGGDGVARHVVFGGPQAAGQDHDFRTAPAPCRMAAASRSRSSPTTVFAVTSTPEQVQLSVSQSEFVSMRCGVSSSDPTAMISAFIYGSGRPLMPASTRYSALFVATTIERDGVNASPTMFGPERNNSGLRVLGIDADDALAARQRSRHIQPALRRRMPCPAGGPARGRTPPLRPPARSGSTASKLDVVGPVTYR